MTLYCRRRLWLQALLTLALSTPAAAEPWKTLADGLELAIFKTNQAAPVGDSSIVILRIDPAAWDLRLLTVADQPQMRGITARYACDNPGIVAAINAGMFQQDGVTHVGYMRDGDHLNCGRWNDYQSVAAFDPQRPGLPAFRLFDLDSSNRDSIRAQYGSVVQNLRLIKRPGQNRWSPQEKRWSEAALGEDRNGRVLFIFCRTPYSMHDLNRILLGLPIDLAAAQHLEGGPEAQMSIRIGAVDMNLVGSYETDFWEDDRNTSAWPIPNLITVARKPPDSNR